jgi:hypothetical protein
MRHRSIGKRWRQKLLTQPGQEVAIGLLQLPRSTEKDSGGRYILIQNVAKLAPFLCMYVLMCKKVELKSQDLWVLQLLQMAGSWVGTGKIITVLLAVKLAYPMPRFVL